MAEVQKSAFSLSSATIMMNPAFDAVSVFDLTPADHSVGMVSEVNVSIDSSIQELLNGVEQVPVDSRRTNMSTAITANVFEMTAKNFMRAQALSGAPTAIKRGVLTAQAAGAAVSLSINSSPVPGEASSGITAVGDIPSGATILIQHPDNPDLVFPTKSSGAATGTGPYTVPIADPYDIPAGMTFPIGSLVWIVPAIPVAEMGKDDLFSVKIAGVLTAYNRPMVYVAPKVRVVRGFQLAYNETQYSSMPWELRPLLMSAGEATGRLAEIGTRRTGMLYAGG